MNKTQRSSIKRHPERAAPGEAPAILAEGLVARVGFCHDGQPFVIPFSYYYDPWDPDKIYLHGATTSRALQHVADDAPICIFVTLLDGLVYSRSAKYHSMNYRSVVLFGRARFISQESENCALRADGRALLCRTKGRTRLRTALLGALEQYTTAGGADRRTEREGATRRSSGTA